MSDGWRHHRRVRHVLDGAEVFHLAVAAKSGPHVTPAVFDVEGDRLWFVTPRRSVKARVIDRERRVGGLVQHGRWSVVFGGRARIVDPLNARGIGSPDRLLDLPFAAAGYLNRNFRHTTGMLRDIPAPALALSRVLVEVHIRRVMLLDGWTVVDHWGRWSRTDRLARGDRPPGPGTGPDLRRVPASIRTLLGAGAPVVLGWPSPAGPLALPAEWQVTEGNAEVLTSAAAMVMAGAESAGPASVCVERSGYRLSSKLGLLMLGQGSARVAPEDEDRDVARVTIDVQRTTWWRGEERHTA